MRLSKKLLLILIALILIFGATFRYFVVVPMIEAPQLSGSLLDQEIDVDGRTRGFHYYVPAELGPGAAVIIAFHGSRGDGRMMRRGMYFEFDRLADEHGVLIVYPDGYRNHWNDCRKAGGYDAKLENVDDLGFVRAMLAVLQEEYRIDPTQVFAVGISNGGHMAYRIALEAPEIIRGAVAIAASMPADQNLSCEPANQAVPVMIINGSEDSINPFEGGEVTLLGPWGTRGLVKSSVESAEYWAQLAGYSSAPFEHRYPDAVPEDNSVAIHTVWSEDGRPEVGLIAVYGGGHTVPHPVAESPRFLGNVNRDFAAVDEIWRFFERAGERIPQRQLHETQSKP
jgi:polyhydroxybutyrate depolymerase